MKFRKSFLNKSQMNIGCVIIVHTETKERIFNVLYVVILKKFCNNNKMSRKRRKRRKRR